MFSAPSPRIATRAAALGHGLILAGFFLPWVVGQFGARDQLSGLDLARLAGDAISHGLAADALALPITRVALLLVPLAAVNALLVLAAMYSGALSVPHAQRLAAWLAAPVAAVALIAIALVLISIGDGEILAGPGIGLPLVLLGASLVLVPALLLRSPSEATE